MIPSHVRVLVLTSLVGLLCLLSASARAAPVNVTVTSAPPGAAVYVDGKEQGLRGLSGDLFKVRLNPGTHKLLLELEGYKPYEATIQVGKGGGRFAFTLERAPGKLLVRAPASSDAARGGELFVDGNPAGTVPAEVELAKGQHLIEVRKPGFKVYSESITLQPAESRTVLVTLEAEIRRGSILVSASSGEVFVDGQSRGPAPAVVENLEEGDHLVEVREGAAGAGKPPLWQDRVRVVSGKQIRVEALIKKEPVGGTLIVLAPPDAEVVVDGTKTVRPGQEIPGLTPGQHIVQVRGKAYKDVTRIVEIEGGKQRVEKIDLEQSAEAKGVGTLRVIMANPVDGAEYFVNGRRVREEQVLAERGMEVAAGTNVVVVRREGYGNVTKTVTVAAGGTETVTLEMKNTGRVSVGSTPPGAEVLIDGNLVGRTPFTSEELPGGPHLVEIRQNGYQPFAQQVSVRGGEQAAVRIDLLPVQGPPGGPGGPGQWGPGGPGGPGLGRPEVQTSFSAVTNDPGHFTVDLGAGFPYFVGVALTVGAARYKGFGFDVGVEARSSIFQTDAGVRLRAQLLRAGPIALGLNTFLGGGGGPGQRNEFVFEVGAPVTLLAGRIVQLTLRPYLQVYSDRLCPALDLVRNGDPNSFGAVADGCKGAIEAVGNGSFDRSPGAYSIDNTNVFDRFTKARFFLQAALEIQATNQLNVWALFEAAPGQAERQAYTNKFSPVMPGTDLGVYGRLGVTFKFSAF